MSRIGKKNIEVPQQVTVEIQGAQVVVSGPKGKVIIPLSQQVVIEQKDNMLNFVVNEEGSALQGLTRTLVANAITGVVTGWTKTLELVGVGYRAQGGGNEVTLTVGYSHPVVVKAPENVSFTVAENTKVTVSGIDKKIVGEVAASIRSIRKPEPYKGKGIRYLGEVVRRKAGKAVKAAA